MDRFLIPKIQRVEESCDVEEEEEMQGVSESDLEEEERRGQRDQSYTWPAGLPGFWFCLWLFEHSFVCNFACSLIL